VNSFKLNSELTFTPQEEKYLILDTATQSTYRIGASEYLILKQFDEAMTVEEVGYRLRAESGVNIPYDKLNQFVAKARNLGMLVDIDDSRWSRVAPSQAFTFRIRFFDPGPLLEHLVVKLRGLKYYLLALAGGLVLTALTINFLHLGELWALRSQRIPPYTPLIVLLIYGLSIGHELLHGLAARWYGLDVTEVGFHLHYFLPSIYCKIISRSNTDRKSLAVVFLAGSLFDLILISLLVLLWCLGPEGGGYREVIALTVSLLWVKILVLQLNPLWPLSDGFRVVRLFVPMWRGKNRG
jgi:hypothetical protein